MPENAAFRYTSREKNGLGNSLFSQTGPLSNFAGAQGHSLNFTTLPFTIPTGTPVTVEMFVEAHAGVLGSAAARAEFGSTLTFNGSGAVFGLPDGFTVNGPNLVDNRWTGAPAPAVPEPASWSLCAAAAGLAVLLRRRNRA
ncbi:MAG: PEP-CTERM sorting domain-containing protein [Acidobacteria bacterium]|nr:PEP-CTERM sorting domain-containing protein [Acidobacteriota bacterium]